MLNKYVGVDPGVSGAIAIIEPNRALTVAAFKDRTEKEIFQLFKNTLQGPYPPTVHLEQVGSLPKDGAQAMFTFGRNYGLLRGVMTGLGIPFEEVPPQVWQRAFGLGGKFKTKPLRKTAHFQKAQQLFPQYDFTKPMADAVLLAEHCYRLKIGI